jgi:nitrogen-specific signal transduction histidine kinase
VLTLTTRFDSDAVLVRVADTGAGRGTATRDTATRDTASRDTGPGLDAARRLVAAGHGGTITVGSRPGRTVVTVRLPVV